MPTRVNTPGRWARWAPLLLLLSLWILTTTIPRVQSASLCGLEFMPCEPNVSTGIAACCEDFTCVSIHDFVPPAPQGDFKWTGRCLSERSKELNLLPEDFKYYMIYEIYTRKEVYSHVDWKTVEGRDYMARAFMEKGEFAQLVYRLEKKFHIEMPIPDRIPHLEEEEEAVVPPPEL